MRPNSRTRRKVSVLRPLSTYRRFPSLPEDPNSVLSSWLRATRVQPVSAMEWQIGVVDSPRRVKDAMWFYILEGAGEGWVGDPSGSSRIQPGDMLLIPREALHSLTATKGHFRYCAVHWYASIHGTADLLTAIGLSGVFQSIPKSLFADINHRLAREYALRAPGWMRALEQGIWEVLLHLIRYQGRRLYLPASFSTANHLLRLKPVFDLIESRLRDPNLRVAELARVLHVSKVALRNLFHQAVGQSPVQFITRRRIEKACLLLLHTDHPIARVAEECGMGHLPYFYRMFKRIVHTTPGEYRTHSTI
ncbi:MAG: helix-turn-helix domain-containing protein [Phycisphaerae bacterium]|nr:helix-turn-helix domain-containing protein [Phycisphaerae bacterium]